MATHSVLCFKGLQPTVAKGIGGLVVKPQGYETKREKEYHILQTLGPETICLKVCFFFLRCRPHRNLSVIIIHYDCHHDFSERQVMSRIISV